MENITENNNQEPQITFYQQETPVEKNLKTAWQILKDAWNIYHSKFKTAIGIMLIPVIISVVLKELSIISISSSVLSQVAWLSFVKIAIWLMSLFFNAVSISALLLSVKNESSVMASYTQSFKSIFSYILVVILGLLVITGGLVLLIIPGIIFSIWFSLAIYSFIFEEKKGFETLYRSKQLVSGNFWKVIWRSIFISIVAILISAPFIIFGYILKDSHEIIGSVLQLFLMPLVIFFEIVLFQNLVEIKQSDIFQEPKKLGKFVYYFSAVIATPLIFGFVVFQGLMFITHDIPSPNDSSLRLSAVNVPREQNAFYAFLEVKDKVYWPQDEIDKNGIDDVLATKILQNNEQTISAFDKGASMSIFQMPELQDPTSYTATKEITSLAFLRNLAKVNSLKASFLFEQGKQKEAFDQSLKTIKMAQMLQDGQNGAIGYLIGLATKEIGLANLRSLIKDSNLSSVELLSFENELNKYKESKLAMQQVLKGEYMVSISSFEEIEKGFRGEASLLDDEQLKNLPSFVVRSFYFYKPNQTKLLNINITQRQLNNANKKSLSEVNKIEYKEPNYWTIVFTENAIGKILSNIREVSFESLYAKRFEENFSVKATQLLLALKAYKQDTGNLPNSLQNLVPNYILELIQDPFDGKSIKYSSDKKEIYSTGKDLIDNGGNISESDWKQGDDLGFKIDF